MKKLAFALTLMLGLGQMACSTDPTREVCERAVDCGSLNVGVERCQEDIQAWFDDHLSSSEQKDCPAELEDCAGRSSCTSFTSCILDDAAYECHPYI